jgi:hypothetical protein
VPGHAALRQRGASASDRGAPGSAGAELNDREGAEDEDARDGEEDAWRLCWAGFSAAAIAELRAEKAIIRIIQ